ncbi:helix-turn-helix domain-containing protein, partial [Erysipelothrix rhusiopathiae]|nr:helix-turn-helix domain-containing protein [Erysipelothrix rhusiopathiae]
QIIAHSGKTDAQDEALIYDIFTEIDNNFAINFLDNHELFRYLKIEDLAERMFVSRTTIHNDLKDVRLQLRRFQLELKSRPAY